MDKFDRALLNLLQRDCSLPVAEMAERVGLGSTACWRRIQKLEEAGLVRQRVALLNAEALGLPVTVFAGIRTQRHTPEWLQQFHDHISALPEVMECYRMAGDTDYLLRIVVADIAGYDRVYKRLIEVPGITDISSSFAMERIKATTALPLAY